MEMSDNSSSVGIYQIIEYSVYTPNNESETLKPDIKKE